MKSADAIVVVTGANGLVGAETCATLVERGVQVRAVVRQAGAAPKLEGVAEVVGDFADRSLAAEVVESATAVVTTVHPMGGDRAAQQRVGVEGTAALARAAAAAGVTRLVHISTAAVYDRSPGMGDIDESSPLVADDANDYAVTKRDADHALASIDGLTRVLLRPPAILGPGKSSTWNALRPAAIRDQPAARRAAPEKTFPWVHLRDLAALAADLASGGVLEATDPSDGPVAGACTPLNVAAGSARIRDYFDAVTGALGVEPVWLDEPAWTGAILSDRASRWGWAPKVGLAEALDELVAGLSRAARHE